VVQAINFGGPAYTSKAGIVYENQWGVCREANNAVSVIVMLHER
jgi:hypothetical protein